MTKEGKISRAYVEVQNIITKYLEKGVHPSTDLLKQAYYSDKYDKDSREQQETIYGCIIRGRENVIKLWDLYLLDTFQKDLSHTEFYEPEECGKELITENFSKFHSELQNGKFGKDTKVIKQNLGHFPAIAIIFQRKMKEFSKKGHNFLTATGGKDSVWRIPSFWAWNIREYKLYNRTVRILYTQLKRGIKTKVLLPSGVPLEETIKYGTVIEAALRDTTSWTCPKCGAKNIAENDKCAICKTEKPVIKVKEGKSKKTKKS